MIHNKERDPYKEKHRRPKNNPTSELMPPFFPKIMSTGENTRKPGERHDNNENSKTNIKATAPIVNAARRVKMLAKIIFANTLTILGVILKSFSRSAYERPVVVRSSFEPKSILSKLKAFEKVTGSRLTCSKIATLKLSDIVTRVLVITKLKLIRSATMISFGRRVRIL